MSTPGLRVFNEDEDWDRLLALLCECYRTDTADMEFYSLNLRASRGVGYPACALEGSDGALLAYAVLWQGRYLATLRHPDGAGPVFDDLLDWAISTLREADGRPDLQPAALTPLVRSDDRHAIQRLKARGMVLVDREPRMRSALTEELDAPETPAGFTIRALDPTTELDGWLELYRAAIGDRPRALEKWRHYRRDPDYRQDLDLIAIDSAGILAGVCTATIGRLETDCGRLEGRTEPIMIAEPYRRIGLGRALVQAGKCALRDAGMEYAALTVEPDNGPAIALYQSLGFEIIYEAQWYGFPV